MNGIKKFLKRFHIVRKLHRKIIEDYDRKRELSYNIDEITPLYGKQGIDNAEMRFNIAIPTLKKEFVFGGITTALNFFFNLAENNDQRILLSDSDVHKEDLDKYSDFLITPLGKKSNTRKQVVACNDRQYTKLDITENDVFIATSWWSAYILLPLIKWQNDTFHTNHKLIYLIQDYEPGFYPWSSKYLLADSTYTHANETIAVFNTKLLKDFINNKGYKFSAEYYFEPVLNRELHNCLKNGKTVEKEKIIIVYGRPSVDRNCFEIIVGSLKYLLSIYPEAENWKFISLGESHAPIALNDNVQLIANGKVSLTEYGNVMLRAYAGISLMASPHPSYPPLEMSTFKVKTITNVYANKDLKDFNNYIVSVNDCSYANIAEELKKIMMYFPAYDSIEVNDSYIDNENTFSQICNSIRTNLYDSVQ